VLIAGFALSDQRNGVIALAILLGSYPLFRGTRRLFRRKQSVLGKPTGMA
jgi:hypothetical protein